MSFRRTRQIAFPRTLGVGAPGAEAAPRVASNTPLKKLESLRITVHRLDVMNFQSNSANQLATANTELECPQRRKVTSAMFLSLQIPMILLRCRLSVICHGERIHSRKLPESSFVYSSHCSWNPNIWLDSACRKRRHSNIPLVRCPLQSGLTHRLVLTMPLQYSCGCHSEDRSEKPLKLFIG